MTKQNVRFGGKFKFRIVFAIFVQCGANFKFLMQTLDLMCSSKVGEFLKIRPQNPHGKFNGVACLKTDKCVH